MKKFLAFVLIFVLIFSCLITVYADEEDGNIVDSANSGFENIQSIEETDWFRLVDSFGNSRKKDLTDITIKTDGGNTGNNYLSMTGDKSWYSPSINLYDFFKEAGAGEYVITYYIRSEQKVPESFMVRGLKSDMEEIEEDEDPTGFPGLIDRGQSNYYRSFPGTLTDNGGWFYFESDPIEVTEENLSKDHNWWFVFGTMLNKKFTIDLDDFKIFALDDYVSPYQIKDTEVSYLKSEVVENVFEAVIPLQENVTDPPTQTQAPNGDNNGATDITLYACIGIGVLACLVAVPVLVIKKKNK